MISTLMSYLLAGGAGWSTNHAGAAGGGGGGPSLYPVKVGLHGQYHLTAEKIKPCSVTGGQTGNIPALAPLLGKIAPLSCVHTCDSELSIMF